MSEWKQWGWSGSGVWRPEHGGHPVAEMSREPAWFFALVFFREPERTAPWPSTVAARLARAFGVRARDVRYVMPRMRTIDGVTRADWCLHLLAECSGACSVGGSRHRCALCDYAPGLTPPKGWPACPRCDRGRRRRVTSVELRQRIALLRAETHAGVGR